MLVLPGVAEEEENGCLEGVVMVGVREGVVAVDEDNEEEDEDDDAAEARRVGMPWKRDGGGMAWASLLAWLLAERMMMMTDAAIGQDAGAAGLRIRTLPVYVCVCRVGEGEWA